MIINILYGVCIFLAVALVYSRFRLNQAKKEIEALERVFYGKKCNTLMADSIVSETIYLVEHEMKKTATIEVFGVYSTLRKAEEALPDSAEKEEAGFWEGQNEEYYIIKTYTVE